MQARGDSIMPVGKKIVAVVDDDPDMLRAIERLLIVRGFLVEAAHSAEAFLASGASRYADCLLLDIHLGKMSGFELRDLLTAAGCPIPIVFITAFDDERTRQQALRAACVDCLHKPFTSQLLFAAIQKAIG
jgi:FixJ family two-component response regulator